MMAEEIMNKHIVILEVVYENTHDKTTDKCPQNLNFSDLRKKCIFFLGMKIVCFFCQTFTVLCVEMAEIEKYIF